MRNVLANLLLLFLLLVGGRSFVTTSESGGAKPEVPSAHEALGALSPVTSELRQALPPSSAMQQPRQLRTVSQNAPSRHGPRTSPDFSTAHSASLSHTHVFTLGGRHAVRIPRVRSRLARWYYVLALRRILC